MKKNIILTLSLFISIILTSCFNDVLDTRLSDTIPIEDAIVDLESLNTAVIGAYSNLQSSDLYGRNILLIPEVLSDNAFIDGIDNTGRYLAYDNLTVSANDSDAEEIWEGLYNVVATTSIIIRIAESLDFPETQQDDANRYLGEAYALRALSLLNLQQFFAQPYNFTADASHLGIALPDFERIGLEELQPARSTTAQVYEQIVSDFQNAITLIPAEDDEFSRIGNNAAKALLARTYLNMGNSPEILTLARDLATEVINTGDYSLQSNGSYLGSWSLDSTDESIFSIVNTLVDNPGLNGASYFYLEYRDAFATQEFINLFQPNDVRLQLYPLEGTTHLVRKFPKFDTRNDNYTVIRLSELYLIKAEAHARLNEDPMAQQALDMIIQRADPAAPVSTETGGVLLNKILTERRKELAFEGFRLFDLTRTATNFTKYRQIASSFNITAPANNTILPIPISELNANTNMTQNPGY